MRFKSTMVSLGLLALAGGASAQGANPMFSFSGFGTIGYSITDSDAAVYSTGTQPKGATKSGSFMPDSRLGLQMNGNFNDTFSGTLQIFAKQDGVGEFTPTAEWAFLKAKLGNQWNVRAGRIGAPFFMTSDFRAVGYTNLTMRTPAEVYAYVPVRTFDGADVLYQGEFGNTVINAQLWAGNTRLLNGGDAYVLLKDSVGISVTAEMGAFTLRAGTMQTTLDADGTGLNGLKTIQGGLTGLSALPGMSSLKSIGTDLGIANKAATFSGLGAVYDSGKWIVNAEYVTRTSDSLYVPTADAWYTTLGYRVNKFTPYVSLAGRNQKSAKRVTAPSTAGLPTPYPQQIAGLIGAANAGVVADSTANSISFGTRWDLGKSYALKGEWMQLTLPAGANGYLPRGSIPGGTGRVASDTTINVFSAAIDFVF